MKRLCLFVCLLATTPLFGENPSPALPERVGNSRTPASEVETAREMVALRPESGAAWHRLGLLHGKNGRIQPAMDAFREASRCLPKDPEVLYNFGVTLGRLKKWDEAIDAYQRSLGLEPRNADGWYNLGQALDARKHLPEALAAFERAVVLATDDADIHFRLGRTLAASGRPEEAYRELAFLRTKKTVQARAQADQLARMLKKGLKADPSIPPGGIPAWNKLWQKFQNPLQTRPPATD
jgi:tetratricopeptide (TPR) repeat protein